METNIYELILTAVPVDSEVREEMLKFISKHKCLAWGMHIDLENDTEEELEELMTTIIAEGCQKYGLQKEERKI